MCLVTSQGIERPQALFVFLVKRYLLLVNDSEVRMFVGFHDHNFIDDDLLLGLLLEVHLFDGDLHPSGSLDGSVHSAVTSLGLFSKFDMLDFYNTFHVLFVYLVKRYLLLVNDLGK